MVCLLFGCLPLWGGLAALSLWEALTALPMWYFVAWMLIRAVRILAELWKHSMAGRFHLNPTSLGMLTILVMFRTNDCLVMCGNCVLEMLVVFASSVYGCTVVATSHSMRSNSQWINKIDREEYLKRHKRDFYFNWCDCCLMRPTTSPCFEVVFFSAPFRTSSRM